MESKVNLQILKIFGWKVWVNPFYVLWKHQKIFVLSGVFRGYKMEALARNGLTVKSSQYKTKKLPPKVTLEFSK